MLLLYNTAAGWCGRAQQDTALELLVLAWLRIVATARPLGVCEPQLLAHLSKYLSEMVTLVGDPPVSVEEGV